jgi:MATE family multidrug resistance protein
MLGLSSGMDPLFAQAFGAQETHALGLILQRGWAVLTVTCLPILAFWLTAEPLLLLLRQDAALAHKAGVYLRFLAVDLVLAAWAQPMRSFLR